MALTDNSFLGLTPEELLEQRALWLQALADIAKTGQSFAFPGLSLTHANLREIREILSDLQVAITVADGRTSQVAYAVSRSGTKFAGRFP